MDSPTFRPVRALFPPRILQWLGPLLAVSAVLALIAAIIALTGIIAFPASVPDPKGFERIVHGSFKNMVAQHSDGIEAPADLDAQWRIMFGAGHFARVCASCHGAPGLGQNPIVMGMRPRPQYLPAVVRKFSPSELFWIVKHGVKFTAMPAYPHQVRDDEIWSIVAFLRQLDTMTPQTYLNLAYGAADPALPNAGRGDVLGSRQPYSVINDAGSHDEFSYTWPAMTFQDTALTGDPITTCAGCHGANGIGRDRAMFPNLTIQSPAYLGAALRAFARGSRPSGAMQAVAVQLTDRQIDRLAEHFGNRFAPPANRPQASQAQLALGRTLERQGVPERKVAACSSCHGVEGASPLGFPRLAGQNPEYLRQQLHLFQTGRRGSTEGYNPMNAEAHNLTDTQIDAISVFYASQPAGPGPAPKGAAPASASAR
ncbi:c-type cytochrome [Novosphingobium aquimarinum]|uniref:c-type cytochrome n=1 Tax=Novosphingobium aquimarinum TaxID=2682494 RepID=UPI0018DB3F11|nr:c-type cytochrome [Novosphingobium aquimarinum]